MKFLIPSYKRAGKQKTLEYLHGMGYRRDEIILSTQTETDYAEYQRNYGDRARIIYGEAHNVSGNRNNLLKTLKIGEKAVMLDDDIASIDRLICLKDAKHPFGRFEKIQQKAALEKVLNAAFAICEAHNGHVFGAYSVHNERMIYGAVQNNGSISKNKLFIGTVFGIIFDGQLFDERYETKEDYAYILRQISDGKPVFRLNSVSPYASHFTKGGCQEAWKSDKNLYSAMLLVSEFPEQVKHNPNKVGEILQIRR